MAQMRLALIQMNLSGTYEDNLEKTQALLRSASDSGASIACLPELFSHPWFSASEDSRHLVLAEAADGKTVTLVREWARAHRIAVIAPIYEADGERRFNTSFLVSEHGDILGRYRKNHIPYHPGWFEKYYYGPGDVGFPVFYHQGIPIAIQTCWDNFFPEGSRILALKGARVIFAPRGSGEYSAARWRTALAANAMANGCFVATVNRMGLEAGRYMFGGDSRVIRPAGETLAAATTEDEALVATLDLDEVEESRREWPFLEDRRPGIYREISEGPA